MKESEEDERDDIEKKYEQPTSTKYIRFEAGEPVLYDNGIWVVHVGNTKDGDQTVNGKEMDTHEIAIIPPGMVKASSDEKNKICQIISAAVDDKKVRKLSPEEHKKVAGPDGIVGTADDGKLFSEGTKPLTNMLDMKPVEIKDTSSLDKAAEDSV